MEIIIGLAVIVAFTVVPVMIAARMLKASNTGFFTCLGAVVLSVTASVIVSEFIKDDIFSLLISLLLTVGIYSQMLGVKYIQSAGIALLSMVIQFGGILLLLAVFGIEIPRA